MGTMTDHARRELELLGEAPETIDWYCRVIDAFNEFGHSGGSAAATTPVLHDLLQFKNLTPLTDDPADWMPVEMGREPTWQSRRRSAAFSNDGGKHYYLVDEMSGSLETTPMHPTETRTP